VPNVVGMTAEEASKVLKDAGFDNVKVVLDNGADATSGDMVKQVTDVNPDAGTSVVGTTQIVLTVGAGGGGLG
jgi:beta-lactam-binding protein with PASTA domain